MLRAAFFPKRIDSSQRLLLTQAWPAQNVAFLPFSKASKCKMFDVFPSCKLKTPLVFVDSALAGPRTRTGREETDLKKSHAQVDILQV